MSKFKSRLLSISGYITLVITYSKLLYFILFYFIFDDKGAYNHGHMICHII